MRCQAALLPGFFGPDLGLAAQPELFPPAQRTEHTYSEPHEMEERNVDSVGDLERRGTSFERHLRAENKSPKTVTTYGNR